MRETDGTLQPMQHGLFVRELRLRRGITLDALSEQTGLSKGHLSRFERGEKFLSLAALLRVAGALKVSVSEIVGEVVPTDALHLVRLGQRKMRKSPQADGAYNFVSLSRPGRQSGPSAFVVEFPARAQRTNKAYHAGEEMFFVIKGRVEMQLADRKIVLDEGDFLQFPGHLVHTVKGLAVRSEVLIVVVDGHLA